MCLSSFQRAVSKYFLKNILIQPFPPLPSSADISCYAERLKAAAKRCWGNNPENILILFLLEMLSLSSNTSQKVLMLPTIEPTPVLCCSCAAPQQISIFLELEGVFLLSVHGAGAAKCPCLGRGWGWTTSLLGVEINALSKFTAGLAASPLHS